MRAKKKASQKEALIHGVAGLAEARCRSLLRTRPTLGNPGTGRLVGCE